ncbi:MAG TPA: UPF0149 family protein [Thiobacillus sp.]|nr:UPF0149 family protein [Thiobacillus sp.]
MMNFGSAPLNDEELEWLDQFLLDRIDDDTDTEGKNEGVLNVSELDGFLTALVSGPVVVPPSRWLPVVWGDFEPEWKSAKEFEAVFALLIRHMNGIAATLMDQPEEFEPLFLERVLEGKTYTIVDEWCEGYVQGVNLTADLWEAGGLEMEILLMPMRAFTSETDWRAHKLSSDVEIENLHKAIARNVREIHAYWLARREADAPSSAPVRRAAPSVGRNDPCPCVSGKKFKKCCLH